MKELSCRMGWWYGKETFYPVTFHIDLVGRRGMTGAHHEHIPGTVMAAIHRMYIRWNLVWKI